MFPLPDPSHLSILPTSCLLSLSSPLSIQTNIKTQKRRPKHTNKQNPNKTKKCQNVTQTSPKNYRVCFVLVNFSWTWDLPWNVLDIPSDSLLEKTDFPFANRNQLKLSSCIGVGLPLIAGTPPPPRLAWTVQALGRLPSLWVYMCISPAVSWRLFPWSSPSPPALTSSLSPL